jgi:hypothetical protein
MSIHSTIDSVRGAKRSRVLMRAVLTTPDGEQRVTIRDISPKGAQLAGVKGIAANSDAVFRRSAVFAPARVVWVKDGEAGLHFYRQLTPDEVAETLPHSLDSAA